MIFAIFLFYLLLPIICSLHSYGELFDKETIAVNLSVTDVETLTNLTRFECVFKCLERKECTAGIVSQGNGLCKLLLRDGAVTMMYQWENVERDHQLWQKRVTSDTSSGNNEELLTEGKLPKNRITWGGKIWSVGGSKCKRSEQMYAVARSLRPNRLTDVRSL